jgi:Fic family protein
LHVYLEKKTKLIEKANESLKKAKSLKLNFRQLALLRHALKHPRFVYTIKEHKNSHGINPQTARKDLMQMADIKLLDKLKHGKSYVFLSPDDLEERIKAGKSKRNLSSGGIDRYLK